MLFNNTPLKTTKMKFINQIKSVLKQTKEDVIAYPVNIISLGITAYVITAAIAIAIF